MLLGARRIRVQIDQASWAPGTAPAAIASLHNSDWNADIDAALVHIALWTRPPTFSGFDLADMWAWLRYGRAISAAPELRLVEPWTDIDAHQKTLLSDDFGVGLSALLLVDNLGMQFLGETRHVIEVLRPGQFTLLHRPKQGPAKSPDYIVADNANRCHAVEFKGTQSTRTVLRNAMERGVAQKQNLAPAVGTTLGWSLVMGVFIPQHDWDENALLRIRDPEIGDLGRLIAQIPVDEVRAAIVQVTLAKCFVLLDVPELASIFLQPAEKVKNMPLSKAISRDVMKLLDGGRLTRTIHFDAISPTRRRNEKLIGTDSFSISMPLELIQEALRAKTAGSFVNELSRRTLKSAWKTVRGAQTVELTSPMGVVFTLA